MGAASVSTQSVSVVDCKRLWKAIAKDGHNVFPKVLPGFIASVSVQGDGGVGSIRQIKFTPANKDFSYFNERIDEIDEENFVFKYTAVEGGQLGKTLSSAKFALKLVPNKEGGCVSTWTCHYDTLTGAADVEAKIQEMKEGSLGLLKVVEGYLLSNPSLYC
eukprot:Gb_29597 [translate_table: standard]